MSGEKFKLVSDNVSTFFKNRRILTSDAIPTEGDYIAGDLIIKSNPIAGEPIGWICVAAGSPGEWSDILGGGGGGILISLKNNVIIPSATNEVNIGINGFDKATDTLLVYVNSVFMTEGVDYEISSNSVRITSLQGPWNEGNSADYMVSFLVFKNVTDAERLPNIDVSIIPDGGIGMDKLGEDVQQAIENASNIDLSGYATIESVNELRGLLDSRLADGVSILNDITDKL